jgi:hypothetical protein
MAQPRSKSSRLANGFGTPTQIPNDVQGYL